MSGRPSCLLPGLAITKQKLPKNLCLLLRAILAYWDLSQFGNWANCALIQYRNGVIPGPVLNTGTDITPTLM